MKYALFLLLTACTTPLPIPDIDGNTYTFQIHLVDTLPEDYKGLHVYDDNLDLHSIWIIKEDYPGCMLHEILHVFDDDWHKGKTSTEYCYSP